MANATAHPAGAYLRGAARLGLALFLSLHGIAHFAGTTGDIALIRTGGTAQLVGGAWPVTIPVALWALAVAWTLTGVGFLVTATMVWTRARGAWTALQAVACVSLLLSAVSLWSAIAGVVIDLALLGVASARPDTGTPSSKAS